jgi:hypothetical protein
MGAFGGAQNRVGAHGIIAHSSSAPSLRRPVDDASVGRGVLSTKAATAAAARTLRVALAFGRASLAALHLLVQLCGGGLSTGSVRAAPSTLGRGAAGPVCRYRYRALRLIALRDGGVAGERAGWVEVGRCCWAVCALGWALTGFVAGAALVRPCCALCDLGPAAGGFDVWVPAVRFCCALCAPGCPACPAGLFTEDQEPLSHFCQLPLLFL